MLTTTAPADLIRLDGNPRSWPGLRRREVSLFVIRFVPLFLAVGLLQVAIGAWLPTVGIASFQVGLLISEQGAAAGINVDINVDTPFEFCII